MKYTVRAAAAVLALMLTMSLCACSGAATAVADPVLREDISFSALTEKEEQVLENTALRFTFDPSTGDITLLNKANNIAYTSKPAAFSNESDSVTAGKNRAAVQAQLMLKVANKKGELSEVNSYTEAVMKQGFKAFAAGNAIRCEYTFPQYGITAAVEYVLKDDRLTARIPVADIKVEGEYRLAEISLLPYFGASTMEQEGYFTVPDGSGALIHFNNGRQGLGNYSQPLYGTDTMKASSKIPAQTKRALLPAIGVHTAADGDAPANGLLIYAESGAQDAIATAGVSNGSMFYNNAYFAFTYNAYDSVTMLQNTSYQTSTNMFSTVKSSSTYFGVSYTPLGEDSEYTGIARITRSYMQRDGLLDESGSAAEDIPVYIRVYFLINKEQFFLGFPYTADKRLTEFSQCRQLLEELDAPVVFLMTGIDDGGAVGGKLDSSFKVSSLLGGKRAYKKFVEYAEKLGAEVYPYTDIITYTKSSLSASTFSGFARAVTNKAVKSNYYYLSNGEINKKYPTSFFVSADKLVGVAEKYIKSAVKAGITSCAPLSLSGNAYTSNDSDTGDRAAVARLYAGALSKMEDAGLDIMLESPGANLVRYADRIYNLPVESSGFEICDTDVPFVQLVLSGIKSYSTPEINLAASPQEMFLKAVETGSSLCFSFIGCDYQEIKATPLDSLYGSQLSLVGESAKQLIAEHEKIQTMIGNGKAVITDHRIISDGVRLVEYDGGVCFILNYTGDAVTYNGITVAAQSYAALRNGVEQK